jgi:alcohol dehydrogenase (cytochrome c)
MRDLNQNLSAGRAALIFLAALSFCGTAWSQGRNLDEMTEQERLRSFGPAGGLAPGVPLPEWVERPNPIEDMSDVSEAMLENPPEEDWLNWRRTYDGDGFSPLDQITRNNVDELTVAWSLALPPGANGATPLVHDGVIFVHSYGDHVQALDATNGNILWHYARDLGNGGISVKRNMALYGDKLFLGTSDVHVIALDIRTGEVVWDTPITEPESGFGLSGGPLVAQGVVMQGVNGQAPGGAYLVGLDTESGEELWRFYSIARPGEPGGNTWNDLPVEQRTGGSLWVPGSYDKETGVAFFGPAPTYDTGPLRDPIGRAGVTNDALYTNATVALDPRTGNIEWYFQHVPNDQWDFDWAFERQMVELEVDGREQRVVITSGKQAIYDALDLDGNYLFSIDLGLQNVFTSIDPETGAKAINPDLIPSREERITVCPHAGGAKSWIPGSVDPNTNILYVPLVETCMDMIPQPLETRGSLSTGVNWTIRPRLDTDGRYGRIQAIDLQSRETLWTVRQRAPQTTGTLVTDGGVVFAGALDRYFKAYDAADGEELWSTRVGDVPSAAPITYSVDGRQYVALIVGYGTAHSMSWPQLTPEIDLPIVRSAALWVYALPEN